MSLGDRIRKARDSKGLKQSELAEMIDVKSAGVISNWEKDINKPDADKIIKLCEVLEISASYLLNYYGNTISVSLEEQEHIKKLRSLDIYGRKAVSTLLDIEYERCNKYSNPDTARIAAYGGGTFDIPAPDITAEELEKIREEQEQEDMLAEIEAEKKRKGK